MAQTDLDGELVALVDNGLGVGGSGFKGAGKDIGGEFLRSAVVSVGKLCPRAITAILAERK